MKLHVPSILLVLHAAAAVIATGCEDSSAKQRDVVQAQITQANLKFQKALAAGGDEAGVSALNAIVTELGQITGGESGQLAAKSILSATALRELANIKLTEIEQLESKQQRERIIAQSRVDAVLNLSERANVDVASGAAAERERLRTALESARTEVTQLRTKIDELDGPISERATINASSKAEVDALRMKVNDLRRRSQELGHFAGFDTYQQAVAAGRQADKIEYDISQREVELDYELTPELTLTDSYAQRFDSMIKSIEEANASLDALDRIHAEQTAATQQQLVETTKKLEADLKALDTEIADQMVALYEEAESLLGRAAGEAQGAVSKLGGADANTARLTAAQVQENIGRLHWAKARGLTDHHRLLERLATMNTPPASANQLKDVATARDSALETAIAAYTNAQELLTQVQSGNNAALVTRFGRSIDLTLATLTGKAAPPPPTNDSETISDDSAAQSVDPASLNFATADELIAFISLPVTTVESMTSSLSVMHATTPQGLRHVKASTDFVDAIAMIDNATREKLGEGIMESLGPMLDSLSPDLSQATVVEQTDNHRVFSVTVMGTTSQVVIRNFDGNWMIDADVMDAASAAQLPAFEQMATTLSQGATGIVARINSGELKSSQEVLMAFGEAMAGATGSLGAPGSSDQPAPPK